MSNKFLPEYDYTQTLLQDVLYPHLTSVAGSLLPIYIVDFKVMAHDILRYSEPIEDMFEKDPVKWAELVKCLWAYKLNRGPDMMPQMDYVCVVVDDSRDDMGDELKDASYNGKGYWRHIEAYKLGMPEYKGGRASKPSLFEHIERQGLEYIKSPGSTFHYYVKPFYEADDIAGKLCRLKREALPCTPLAQRYMLLGTLDGDWQGLVSDEHGIIWCNTAKYLPRVRSEREVCDFYLRQAGLHMTTARETYTTKVEIGDSGDNLLPGSPLRFFDLYEEDPTWGWAETDTKSFLNVLNSNTKSNNDKHLAVAARKIASSGLCYPTVITITEEVADHLNRAKIARTEKSNPELRGYNKKFCVHLTDKTEFEECKKVAVDDDKAKAELKKLQSSAENMSEEELKALAKDVKNIKLLRERLKEKLKGYAVV